MVQCVKIIPLYFFFFPTWKTTIFQRYFFTIRKFRSRAIINLWSETNNHLSTGTKDSRRFVNPFFQAFVNVSNLCNYPIWEDWEKKSTQWQVITTMYGNNKNQETQRVGNSCGRRKVQAFWWYWPALNWFVEADWPSRSYRYEQPR